MSKEVVIINRLTRNILNGSIDSNPVCIVPKEIADKMVSKLTADYGETFYYNQSLPYYDSELDYIESDRYGYKPVNRETRIRLLQIELQVIEENLAHRYLNSECTKFMSERKNDILNELLNLEKREVI